MEVHTATPEDFDANVLEVRGEVVVVYFWGPDCPNCDFFASRLPHLRAALADVPARLVKVDAVAQEELARRFAIVGIPAFHLFVDGRHLGKMSEFKSDAYWLSVVREHAPT